MDHRLPLAILVVEKWNGSNFFQRAQIGHIGLSSQPLRATVWSSSFQIGCLKRPQVSVLRIFFLTFDKASFRFRCSASSGVTYKGVVVGIITDILPSLIGWTDNFFYSCTIQRCIGSERCREGKKYMWKLSSSPGQSARHSIRALFEAWFALISMQISLW